MRKLRKFLRILLIILPFSLIGLVSANEIEGTTDNNLPPYPLEGITDAINGNDPISVGLKALFETQKERWLKTNALYNSITEDYNAGRMSAVGRNNYEKFEGYLNHYLTYGTTEEIPGEEITSDEWAIPYQISVALQYEYKYRDYPNQGPYWTEYVSFNVNDINGELEGSYTDPWGAVCDYTYSRGIIRYTFDFSGVDPGIVIDNPIIRAKVFSYTAAFSGINKILTPYPAGDNWLVATRDCTITNGDTINIQGGRYDYFVKSTSADSYIQILWYDFTFGGVPAVDIPTFDFPSKTNPDGTTNNYYDQEVNNYYYYQNMVNSIQNAGRTEDFTFDIEWGLLNLPAGIMLGLVSALGDYSSHCVFQVQSMTFDIFGNDFTIPAMSFNFNADEYAWLLPFRYIIALLILYALAKGYWGLISNLINGGDDNAI